MKLKVLYEDMILSKVDISDRPHRKKTNATQWADTDIIKKKAPSRWYSPNKGNKYNAPDATPGNEHGRSGYITN